MIMILRFGEFSFVSACMTCMIYFLIQDLNFYRFISNKSSLTCFVKKTKKNPMMQQVNKGNNFSTRINFNS